MAYPNGLSSNFSYDSLNRLKVMDGYQYQLGPTANRTSATEPGGQTLSWSYDGIYRLTNETISGGSHNGSVTYGLDPVGNRQSQTSSMPSIPNAIFAYDQNDRILSTESYDSNGNTTVSGARTFGYDFENRLKSMALNNGPVSVTLQYDGDGNRVAKTVTGVTTRYLVDDLNPTGYAQLAEELVSGTVQRTYTYGSKRISQNQLVNGTWKPSFYGYDGGGTVRALTDATGTVTDTYDYDAWGNVVNTTGSTPNTHLYRGEQYDPDLVAYYLRSRYFNPLTGRFLTRDGDWGHIDDPITRHKYLYGNSSPVDVADPSGRGKGVAQAALLAALLLNKFAPEAEEAGLEVRGWVSLGVNSMMRAGKWWDILAESDLIRAKNTVVASGVFRDASGRFINATALAANRWTPALKQAVQAAEAAGEEMMVKIQWEGYPDTKSLGTGAYHAEQILIQWAIKNGYQILSIASAMKSACEQYCMEALAQAAARQGFPIFFY